MRGHDYASSFGIIQRKLRQKWLLDYAGPTAAGRTSMMKRFTARPASTQHFTLGEGPLWDSRRDRVLWVDIIAGQIWDGVLDPGGIVAQTTHHFGEMIGAAVPTSDGGILAAGQKKFHAIAADGTRYESEEIIGAALHSRFNDGSCDPAGRFFIGSMSLDGTKGTDNLYLVDGEGQTSLVDAGFSLSNGIGWSPDGTQMYHVDSVEKTLWRMPYDLETGNPGERIVVLNPEKLAQQFPENPATPDGMAVDAEGYLWVAYWGAGQVRCHDPRDGAVQAVVDVPAPNTTSATFVGPGQDQLLITTARDGLSAQELEDFPDSGRLFLADVGARGFVRAPWSGVAHQIGAR